MSKDRVFSLSQSGQTGSDCTARYSVTIKDGTTIEEFMKEVLSRNEWGYVNIDRHPRIEYKRGSIVEGEWEDVKDAEVVMADAHGGWSRMDYRLLIE